MSAQKELTADQLAIIEKVRKLLALAEANDNPNEAAAAGAKAQKLLADYNLESANVEGATQDDAREAVKLDGGTHAFQRDLWRAVAELNFCSYWAQEYTATETKHVWSKAGASLGTQTKQVKRHRHNLIGRIVNARMTVAMATYLLEAIERVLRERLNGAPAGSNWAWSFRKGAASTLVGKLYDRRAEYIAEENERARRAAASSGPASGSTALTLTTFAKSEKERNDDFRFGEGWSARQAIAAAKAVAAHDKMRKAFTEWREKHPKAPASKFKFTDENGTEWRYGRASSGRSARDTSINADAYDDGRQAAEDIGLDTQVAHAPQGRLG